VGVEQALAVIDHRRHEITAPPPVLVAVADAWRLGAAGGEADRAAQILDRLSTAWPAWAQALAAWQAPAEAPGCAAVVPGASPLVVVRQRQADGEALRRIALGWGDALVRRGVAWCVWRPPGVAPASTVHWHGFEAENLLQALAWLLAHSRCGRFVFVDDDVELDVDAWLAGSGPAHHLHGVVSPGEGGASLAVGLGLGLSRAAARSACQLAETRRGAAARLRLGDGVALVSELLGWLGIAPSDEGHAVHLRRVPSAEGVAEGPALFHNAWPPGRAVTTVLAAGPAVEGDDAPFGLPRIWPPDQPPRLPGGAVPAQQLVRLSPDGRADDAAPEPCVIAVARNERVLLPHFLAHYRALGVRRFIIADNLSTDGSREYLLSQPDVCVYSVDTAYRDSHYGVAWQLAMLTEHAQRGWALVADIDEFLTWPGCEREGLAALCERLDAAGHDAATALMVDMYPQGALEEADFERTPPFEAAPFFDAKPVLPWRLGSGSYSQGGTWVSAVRHRLIPHSPPNHYTAQKLPLLRYHAGVRLSEGLHYACGLNPAPQPVFLAHFKYHRGFRAKVEEEIARKQHFNGAEEYRKYRELWAEARGIMFDTRLSQRYETSHSFSNIAWI
jgi:Glycosyl transferase family 2